MPVRIVSGMLELRVVAPRGYGKFARRRARGVTVAGTPTPVVYTCNLTQHTPKSARKWIRGVHVPRVMQKQARTLVAIYYKAHSPQVVRYKGGKRLRGHVLAVQLNRERSARARAMDAHQTSRHLLRNPTDANISRWWNAGHGRRMDIHRVDSQGRKAGRDQVK